MKAKIDVIDDGFKPFDLVVRIENSEELRAMYAVFNHTANCALFNDLADCISIVLQKHGCCSVLRGEVIANGVLYEDFYNRANIAKEKEASE